MWQAVFYARFHANFQNPHACNLTRNAPANCHIRLYLQEVITLPENSEIICQRDVFGM
jgi:hypothetical protein